MCGVSLAYLEELLKSLLAIENWLPEETSAIVKCMIAPITARYASRGRFWDLIPGCHVGTPSYYVIHAWHACLSDTIPQLISCLCQGIEDQGAADTTQGAGALQKFKETTYVWLDILALNQNNLVGAEIDLLCVKETLCTCKNGAVVVVDPAQVVLSRVWCMYEAWAMTYYSDCTKVKVAFPSDVSIEDMFEFEASVQRLEMSLCESSKPEDKAHILWQIKHTVGSKLMRRGLVDALLRSSRAALRFSTNARDVAMYCALLLKAGEFCRLQQVMHLMDELEDDEKTFKEIRDIFSMYDSDGSGELDESEFIEVLKATGFTEEEAELIFKEVNTDGDGGVSIAEFETWWMLSQRQQNQRHRKAVIMTGEGLITNLRKMVVLLQRLGLSGLEEFFQDYLDQMEAGKLVKRSQQLMASPLKGDWAAITDKCAWQLHNEDFRKAAKALYDLLMWNSDALDYNPQDIPPADKLVSDTEVLEGLVLYLHLFGCILMHQPGRKAHAMYFQKYAADLRASVTRGQTREGSRRRLRKDGMYSSNARFDFQKFGIVRDMISLKYGATQPISRPLIVEAELSLSQWMAANKKDLERRKGDNVDQLASNYLTTAGVDALMPVSPRGGRASLSGSVSGFSSSPLTPSSPALGVTFPSPSSQGLGGGISSPLRREVDFSPRTSPTVEGARVSLPNIHSPQRALRGFQTGRSSFQESHSTPRPSRSLLNPDPDNMHGSKSDALLKLLREA